ncbi:hypothetical protein [Streptomyces sp. ADI96-02]|uniref:hypothetical protein n=1 Tax=Streptomyces sp. ADI96-02 TaxID=1522760 RepID=UPI000F54EFB2|nr:hypothetical protein [Streptomyces sp. ADI96-02]
MRTRASFLAVATLTMPLALSFPASAAPTSCPSSGQGNGGVKCTTLTNGILATMASGKTFAEVGYYRTGGGNLTAKLGAEKGGKNFWSGNINMNNTPFHYGSMLTVSSGCGSVIGKMLADGSTYTTPPKSSC